VGESFPQCFSSRPSRKENQFRAPSFALASDEIGLIHSDSPRFTMDAKRHLAAQPLTKLKPAEYPNVRPLLCSLRSFVAVIIQSVWFDSLGFSFILSLGDGAPPSKKPDRGRVWGNHQQESWARNGYRDRSNQSAISNPQSAIESLIQSDSVGFRLRPPILDFPFRSPPR
jgi:hypothetical protein